MHSPEEIVRVCALVVSTATGIDPLVRKDERKGDAQLQYARCLWVHLAIVECGVNKARAESLCARSRRAIEYYLAEIEEWRSADSAFDSALERWGDSARNLLSLIFDLNNAAPSRRDRLITRAVLTERAA